MTVQFRDYRDFVIWFDAWTEDKKKLTGAELERLREAVHSIPVGSPTSAPPAMPQPPKLAAASPDHTKPRMSGGIAMSAGP